MKNRSKCNFFRYSGQSNLRPSYGQRSFWPNMTVLRSKMSENIPWCISDPVIIWRKGKGVVHEKSVKMQLLPILLQIKSPTLIWIESLSSKDDRPHFKNGRAQLVAHQQPYHYIGEIVRGWSMKNRSKCNFFQYSGQSNRESTYG